MRRGPMDEMLSLGRSGDHAGLAMPALWISLLDRLAADLPRGAVVAILALVSWCIAGLAALALFGAARVLT